MTAVAFRWRSLMAFLAYWVVLIFGGGVYALLLMRECRNDLAGSLVILAALLTLIGGLVAVVRGRPTRSAVARSLAIAFAAYAVAVGYCNWPSAAEREYTRALLKSMEERNKAEAQKVPGAPDRDGAPQGPEPEPRPKRPDRE